jgi:AcrR family transcriptional regulator
MADRRQEILDAALALADERGLDAVSMRAVAERTGVTPMALYPQVGSKAELLDGMVERLLSELIPPGAAAGESAAAEPGPAAGTGPAAAADGQDWRVRLRALAHAFRKLAHGHPWAATLLFSRPSVTPDAARVVDLVYTNLLEAGVPASEVPRVERLVSTYMIGYVASEVGGRFVSGELNPRARRGLVGAVRAKALPGHAALARWLEPPVDWDAEFEADLDDLMRLIEAAARRAQT